RTARQVSCRMLSPRPRYTFSYHWSSISSGVPLKPSTGSVATQTLYVYSWARTVSESGRSCHGDGDHGPGLPETVKTARGGPQSRARIRLKHLSPRLSPTSRNTTRLTATWRDGDRVPLTSQLAEK